MPNIGSLFLAMFAEVELLSVGLVFNTLKKRLYFIEMDFIISKQVKCKMEVNCPSCSICSYWARGDKLKGQAGDCSTSYLAAVWPCSATWRSALASLDGRGNRDIAFGIRDAALGTLASSRPTVPMSLLSGIQVVSFFLLSWDFFDCCLVASVLIISRSPAHFYIRLVTSRGPKSESYDDNCH